MLKNYDEVDRKKAEDLKKVRDLLVKLGYGSNTEIKSNREFCGHNIYDGVIHEDAVHNFMWHEIDNGKLIIVSDGFGPLHELTFGFLFSMNNPRKVIFFEKTLNGYYREKEEIAKQFKDSGIEFEIIPE